MYVVWTLTDGGDLAFHPLLSFRKAWSRMDTSKVFPLLQNHCSGTHLKRSYPLRLSYVKGQCRWKRHCNYKSLTIHRVSLVLVTTPLLWRAIMTKETYRIKQDTGSLLTVTEGRPLSSWWGASQHSGRSGSGSVTQSLSPDRWQEAETGRLGLGRALER